MSCTFSKLPKNMSCTFNNLLTKTKTNDLANYSVSKEYFASNCIKAKSNNKKISM